MHKVTVYRVDFQWKTKDPIGMVLEKRKKQRSNNNYDLLRLARRLFASDTVDAGDIIIDVNAARRAASPERDRDCSAERTRECPAE